MEKRITITEETTNPGLVADKGTRIASQVENNLDTTKALNDDEDIDDADAIEDIDDELEDDENVTEETVIVEEDVDEDDLDDDEDDDDEDA